MCGVSGRESLVMQQLVKEGLTLTALRSIYLEYVCNVMRQGVPIYVARVCLYILLGGRYSRYYYMHVVP